MERLILITLAILFASSIYAQTDNSILNRKIGDAGVEGFKELRNLGVLSEKDNDLLFNLFSVFEDSGMDANNLTFGQLIDSLNLYKKKIEDISITSVKTGNDSIFIRYPMGVKIFMGMGEMSLEKIVERESKNLPDRYEIEKLNESFDNYDGNDDLGEKLDESKFIFFINTILILEEMEGNISKYRIGDILEITNRTLNSKEFLTFLEKAKEKLENSILLNSE